MAAFITGTIGLHISVYDQVAAGLTGPLKAARGFARMPPIRPGGFVVSEVWGSAEDHRALFDSAVKPNMPDGVPVTIEVTELAAPLPPEPAP
jgi:hypothetical protein